MYRLFSYNDMNKIGHTQLNVSMRVLQLMSKSSSGVRAKLVAREIGILQRELDTKAVVYVMGRAHMHMRSQAKSVFDWYAPSGCVQLVLSLCLEF